MNSYGWRWVCSAVVALATLGLAFSGYAESFTFVQVCDPQLGVGGYEHDVGTLKQAVVQINALEPDLVVICGDLINKMMDEEAYADFKEICGGFAMPWHAAPGNHDVGAKCSAKLLEMYRRVMGKDYYAFSHKGCRFVMTNTSLWKTPFGEESARHDAWFEGELKAAAAAGERIFVVGHYPLYLESPDEGVHGGNLPLDAREGILERIEKYGVVAVLSGHIHRNIVNDYKGAQLVTSAVTSKNAGGNVPLGFRVWTVGDTRPFAHEYVALEE